MIRELLIESPTEEDEWQIEWRIALGDRFSSGEVIATIETSAATQELQADCEAKVESISKTPRGWKLIIETL